MKGSPPHRRGSRRRPPENDAERLVALRAYAVQLFDKGDGHGVSWARVASACLNVGFGCLRELPHDDERRHASARRAHDVAYGLMTGTPDSETPYLPDEPERPPFTPEAGIAPAPGLRR